MDAKGACVCMYKRKNVSYVYWRAAREQMRNKVSRDRFVHKLRHRMAEPHPDIDGFMQHAEVGVDDHGILSNFCDCWVMRCKVCFRIRVGKYETMQF